MASTRNRPAIPAGFARATHCVVALFAAFSLVVATRAAAAADKLNVNTASAAELAQVPGIDATLAVRIVARRTGQGPFKKPDDLMEIPGFTKLVFVQAIDHLDFGPPAAAAAPAAPLGNGKKVDLNKASFTELLLLPDMTPRAAKAIHDYQEKHTFQSVEDLDKVPGLDKRLIVTLLDHVEVNKPAGGAVAANPKETPGDTATLGENGWSGSWVSKLEATPTPVPAATPKPALAAGEKIDLNTADRSELERLPDIGPVMSQRIVEYRTRNGSFKSVDGLLQVRGIGQQRLAAMRQYVTVGGGKVAKAAATPAPRATPKEHPTAVAVAATPAPTPKPTAVAKIEHPTPDKKAVGADGRVNINLANVDDLLTLPRMTREAAGEIVAFRQKNGPFHDPHGITDVPSIGEATYARIRDKITVGE